MHVCVYLYFKNEGRNVRLYACIFVFTDGWMHAYMHICVCIYMHAYMHACMNVFMYVCRRASAVVSCDGMGTVPDGSPGAVQDKIARCRFREVNVCVCSRARACVCARAHRQNIEENEPPDRAHARTHTHSLTRNHCFLHIHVQFYIHL